MNLLKQHSLEVSHQTYQRLKSKVCKSCNKDFQPNSGIQSYCTAECKKVFTQKPANSRSLCCLHCKNTFTATGSTSKFCSKTCRDLAHKLTNRETRHCPECNLDMTLMQASKKFCTKECKMRYNSKQKYTGVEGIDYITCPLCFVRTRQFTPDHAAMHGYNTISEFAKDNNISVITCSNKKEKQSGENNPAFNHNGKLSSWSKNYINGYKLEKHQQQIEKHKKFLSDSKDKFKTNIEYWLKLYNNDVEQATKAYQKFQRRDLLWFVEKYGEVEGKNRYTTKTEKWLSTMHSKSEDEKNRINKAKAAGISSTSKPEYELFSALLSGGIAVEHQFSIKRDENRRYNYDIGYNNKIIEFNGDFWHCNPLLFEENFYNKRTKKTAQETWKKDQAKIQFATDLGYEVLIVWENNYKTNKEQVIQECINFLIK